MRMDLGHSRLMENWKCVSAIDETSMFGSKQTIYDVKRLETLERGSKWKEYLGIPDEWK